MKCSNKYDKILGEQKQFREEHKMDNNLFELFTLGKNYLTKYETRFCGIKKTTTNDLVNRKSEVATQMRKKVVKLALTLPSNTMKDMSLTR